MSQFDPNVWSGRASQEVFVKLAVSGLASMYPASGWSSLGSGPSWKSARLRSHCRTGLSGSFGSPVFADAGKTDPPSRLILSQTSAGNPVTSAWAPSCAERSSRLGGRLSNLARLEGAAMGENAPCDARQLVGKRDRQYIAVQPPLGRLDPGFEPVAFPVLRSDQYDPGGLNEEDAQVAIAALRYLAKDRAVSRRELLGDKTQPSGEVAALGERIPGADRRHHRAGDNRPDPRHAHQPLATGILARKGSDLARQTFDPLIQPTPVAGQILDEVNHARGQHRAACRENAWQPGTQEAPPLPHRDPTLQEEGADLIDDTGTLADQTLTHPVQRLQVQLIGALRGHELHRRALDRLGDRLRVAEVVLLSLRVGADVLRRHQPGIVAQQPKPAAEMMGTDTGLHADQAGRHVGKLSFHLAARPLLPQHDCATPIEADDVERVLADIDTDCGDHTVMLLNHGVLLSLGASCQL